MEHFLLYLLIGCVFIILDFQQKKPNNQTPPPPKKKSKTNKNNSNKKTPQNQPEYILKHILRLMF